MKLQHIFYGTIPKNWKVAKLQNHVIIKGRIGWKGLSSSEYIKKGPFLVRGIDFINHSVNWKICERVTEERYKESPEIMLRKEDILMTKDGAKLGKFAYIDDLSGKATVASHIHVIRNNSKEIRQRYIFYFFQTKAFTNLIQSRIEGSVVPSLYQRDINEMEIIFPPLENQDKIIEILDALVEKIIILRKMNMISEKIIHTIFKTWFLDFAGQTKFIDSKFGKIPQGWKVEVLGNLVDCIKGCSYRSEDLKPSKSALITLKSIKRHGGYSERGLKSYVGDHKLEQIVKDGEVVVAYTDITQQADVLGQPAIVRNSNFYSTLIASLDLAIIRKKNKIFSNNFVYCLLKTKNFQNHAYSYCNGTTVLHLDKNAVPNYEFILPSVDIISKFDKLSSKLIEFIDKNHLEISHLETIYDSLLEKLMTGEIKL